MIRFPDFKEKKSNLTKPVWFEPEFDSMRFEFLKI
jgi:hypothetical protein